MIHRTSFPVVRTVLPNGLTLLAVPRRDLPIASLTLLVRGGIGAQQAGEDGLANLLAVLFPQGTRSRSALELADAVESLGSSLGVHADYDSVSLGLSCASRDLEAALALLAEVALSPAFAAEELERKRRDILSQIERREDDLGDKVRRKFSELIYGDHPYRSPRLGYRETVARHTRESVSALYDRLFTPGDAILVGVGDLEPADLSRAVGARFGAWTAAREGSAADVAGPVPRPGAFPERTSRIVETIEKNGISQATVRVGGLGIARRDPDHSALQLVNYILGGAGFGSRLMKNLREERGLTYGVYSGFAPRREAGHFSIGFQTSLPNLSVALGESFREVERLLSGGITEEERAWAERYFTGSMPLSFQTNDQLAMHLLEQELYGLEPEFWWRELEEIQALTVSQLDAAARRHLHPERWAVVALGDFDGAPLSFSL